MAVGAAVNEECVSERASSSTEDFVSDWAAVDSLGDE